MEHLNSNAYQQLVADATARIQVGQLAAFRAVNKELITMYWDLGKMILKDNNNTLGATRLLNRLRKIYKRYSQVLQVFRRLIYGV